MTIEAATAFVYRWPGGEILFTPGLRVEVSDDRGRRILARAGDKVRVLAMAPHGLQVGQRIAFKSPLFGECTGVVSMLPDAEGVMVVDNHSVLGGLVTIDAGWIVRGEP